MSAIPQDLHEWLQSNTTPGAARHALVARDDRRQRLVALGISEGSALGEFYLTYGPDRVTGWYELNTLEEIAEWTTYAHEELEVQGSFLALSSTEGEGIVLYDTRSGAVYDVTFGQFEELEAGELPPTSDTFVEFLRGCRDRAETDSEEPD